MIDMIVERREMKKVLGKLLVMLLRGAKGERLAMDTRIFL